MHLLYTRAALIRGYILATNQRKLALAQVLVNVYFLKRDVEGTVFGVVEPRVDLPGQVEEDEDGKGEVGGEESFGVGGAADGLLGRC